MINKYSHISLLCFNIGYYLPAFILFLSHAFQLYLFRGFMLSIYLFYIRPS